jgi:hypothetical protein
MSAIFGLAPNLILNERSIALPFKGRNWTRVPQSSEATSFPWSIKVLSVGLMIKQIRDRPVNQFVANPVDLLKKSSLRTNHNFKANLFASGAVFPSFAPVEPFHGETFYLIQRVLS